MLFLFLGGTTQAVFLSLYLFSLKPRRSFLFLSGAIRENTGQPTKAHHALPSDFRLLLLFQIWLLLGSLFLSLNSSFSVPSFRMVDHRMDLSYNECGLTIKLLTVKFQKLGQIYPIFNSDDRAYTVKVITRYCLHQILKRCKDHESLKTE